MSAIEGDARTHLDKARRDLVKQWESLQEYLAQLNRDMLEKSSALEQLLGYQAAAKAQIIGVVQALNALNPLVGAPPVPLPEDKEDAYRMVPVQGEKIDGWATYRIVDRETGTNVAISDNIDGPLIVKVMNERAYQLRRAAVVEEEELHEDEYIHGPKPPAEKRAR